MAHGITRGIVVLMLSLAFAPTPAQEPKPPVLTPEEQALAAEAERLNDEAVQLYERGRPAEAVAKMRQVLALRQKLYSATKYPDGHPDLAASLNNLGGFLQAAGRAEQAVPFVRQALEMLQKLYPPSKYPDGHSDLAQSLNNMGSMLQAAGRAEQAVPFVQQGLEMTQKLYPRSKYPDGHPDLVTSFCIMGDVLEEAGQAEQALPFYRQGLEMTQKLYPPSKYPDGHPDLARLLNNLGSVLVATGRAEQALPSYRQALEMRQKLYPASEYPNGHPDLARSLNNLGYGLEAMGRVEQALPYYRQALEMMQKLYPPSKYPDGHPSLARSLSNLGYGLQAAGRAEEAVPLYRQSLEMMQNLYPASKYPNGHANLAQSLNNLGYGLQAAGRLELALQVYRQGLEMFQKLYPASKYPDGHNHLAISLSNTGYALNAMGRAEQALPYFRQALEMIQKLYPTSKYPNGHPELATILSNVGSVLRAMGRAEEALPYLQQGLEMYQKLYSPRLYPDGPPNLARSLSNMGSVLEATGRAEQALPFYRQTLTMNRRLAGRFAVVRSEGEALNFLNTVPLSLGSYLSVTSRPGIGAETVYDTAWQSKAALARAYQRRHLAARAATTSAEARARWAEETTVRRERAGLLLAPQPTNADSRRARDERLAAYDQRLESLRADLRRLLPELDRADALDDRTPHDLQQALPANTSLVDLFRYTRSEQDPKVPGTKGEKRTVCYVAFVVMREAIARVELGPADPIETNLTAWRKALQAEGEPPTDLPKVLRRDLWEKVAARLPAGTATVYISPDGPLAFLPWAALPGKEPGTVLLEDHALAVVPSGPFLFEMLTAPKTKDRPVGMLAVGGVGYADETAGPTATPSPPDALRSPAAGEGAPLTWPALPGTAAESERVVAMAAAAGVPTAKLTGAEPSTAGLMAELPRHRYAHLATHGFFLTDKTARAANLDEGLFRLSVSGRERMGAAALSPFVLSGLVCAGANRPTTPSRGLLTAEALINADLSGMDLAVLSACQTGLGDFRSGEGVFGLQQAFHVAGCRDVVASLWAVSDTATAALMDRFYRKLWEQKQPPIEALRQAQLELRRHPELAPGQSLRAAPGAEEDLRTATDPKNPPTTGPKGPKFAPPQKWAAFTLSGPGR